MVCESYYFSFVTQKIDSLFSNIIDLLKDIIESNVVLAKNTVKDSVSFLVQSAVSKVLEDKKQEAIKKHIANLDDFEAFCDDALIHNVFSWQKLFDLISFANKTGLNRVKYFSSFVFYVSVFLALFRALGWSFKRGADTIEFVLREIIDVSDDLSSDSSEEDLDCLKENLLQVEYFILCEHLSYISKSFPE